MPEKLEEEAVLLMITKEIISLNICINLEACLFLFIKNVSTVI